MSFETVAFIALVLAAIPCGLFLLNLGVYRRLPRPVARPVKPVSVLIPARNEERNIRATLEAVRANRGCAFEVVVLDDHSTDRTAQIVLECAAGDPRVRLESAPPLPAGWCGKQHACHVLAQRARYSLLLFIDADVRLASDALERMSEFMERSETALASGVPRQELGTVSERLLIPLIHFVLLGFLPMHAMRRNRLPSMSAGCGQLFMARREAYRSCGGHARLRDSLHDGIKLPRVFREAGFATDLFDATDLAVCRMYCTDAETWRGLGKNATEGLAAPGTIVPMTLLLLGGQVVPFVLLAFAPVLSTAALWLSAAAAVMAWLPRFLAAGRFQQPWSGAFFHPLGVAMLLGIQWRALMRHLAGKPSEWKGRSYHSASAPTPVETT
ncbi:MAG: glycosyltransferase [Verrucomicrobiota bacterium]